MLKRILVANRGEIAVRIIRTIKEMGRTAIAVYNLADERSLHVLEADEAYCLGEGTVAQTYLNQTTLMGILKEKAIDAVHPGYGLLSENAEFARTLEKEKILFLGPTPEQIEIFGLKHKAREAAVASGVPLLPGTELLSSPEEALDEAEGIGYPVILKSTAGGGGIGMRICSSREELKDAYDSTVFLAEKNFSDGGVYLEKYLSSSRHVEVQIFGDGSGAGWILGDRDCSVQRRSQKVIEETPAPGLTEETRKALHECAERLMKQISYRSAGTIEFLFDQNAQHFFFLEVNTRLQVEHTVTEEVFQTDIVKMMILLQEGGLKDFSPAAPEGAAMQFRVYAEDPYRNFQPSTGKITYASFPTEARVDTWIESGSEISPFFDPLLAKIIIKGRDRKDCLEKAGLILQKTRIEGVETNLEFLQQIASSDSFNSGRLSTSMLEDLTIESCHIDIFKPGTFTSVQDYPGRVGYWQVGVPPSGPMDSLSFQIGNRLLGNPQDTAGLEITGQGPELSFRGITCFVITGSQIEAVLDGTRLNNYQVYQAEAGSVLSMASVSDSGQRSYLLFQGGIELENYLGSKSTFTLGGFGGHGGRTIRAGDVLHLKKNPTQDAGENLNKISVPSTPDDIVIDVMYGPHGAPDFFEVKGIKEFLEAIWQVHFNSSRTGVRLIGPAPVWARDDGGEAGLHPSNIHDNAYAIGAIDFTGDMPIILGPDGPSLGGFVCPFTIIKADLWKMGQLSVKSRIRFNPVSSEYAEEKYKRQLALLEKLPESWDIFSRNPVSSGYSDKDIIAMSPILASWEAVGTDIVVRQAGDDNILMEMGELNLSIEMRLLVHLVWQQLEEKKIPGIIDLTPGIRSLQIHFNPVEVNRTELLKLIKSILSDIRTGQDITVPSRIVHLPLSWDDPQARLAMEKYQTTVREDAPWCPDNIEFIKRINGLDSIEEVKDVLFNASYLVMGLGDVYLGAPVATPVDPRQRLVTTKYNPARTWTPENAVGIGGAYLCVYGMEGPGGYQLCGRTLQMWNTFKETGYFQKDKPYLLRFFDQIRFFLVSPEELLQIRRDFPMGRYDLKIEETEFNLEEYKQFLEDNASDISEFKEKQTNAFEEEKQEWIRTGKLNFSAEDEASQSIDYAVDLEEGMQPILSPVSGSLWKSLVEVGDTVEPGQSVAVIESMKMEIYVETSVGGVIRDRFCEVGKIINNGDTIFAVEELVHAD